MSTPNHLRVFKDALFRTTRSSPSLSTRRILRSHSYNQTCQSTSTISTSRSMSTTQSQDPQIPSETGSINPSSNNNNKTYPFSKSVISSNYTQLESLTGLGLMSKVEQKLISTCVNQEYMNLFKKNHPDSIRPLSIIKVESYTNQNRTTSNVFTGILMGIRRRGTETSFRLRSIIERTGVELKFNVLSPIIKSIEIIKKSGDLKGSHNGKPIIRLPRRAKLFYLRNHPQKMPDIRKILRNTHNSK